MTRKMLQQLKQAAEQALIAGIKEGKEKEAVAMYNEIMETIFKYSYTPVMLVLEGTTIDGEKLKEMADIIKDSIKTRPSYGKHNI
jgi:hypothetical protein